MYIAASARQHKIYLGLCYLVVTSAKPFKSCLLKAPSRSWSYAPTLFSLVILCYKIRLDCARTYRPLHWFCISWSSAELSNATGLSRVFQINVEVYNIGHNSYPEKTALQE